MSLTYESGLFLMLTLTAVSLGIFAWSRRHTTNAMNTTWLMLTIALWMLALAMELQSPNLNTKLLWVRVQILAQVNIPLLVFSITLTHTGQKSRLTSFSHAGLALMSVLTLGIAIFKLPWILTPKPGDIIAAGIPLDFQYGGWFWILQFYAYLLFVYSAFMLFMYVWHSPHPYREQTTSLLFALLLPVSSNLLHIFDLISVDITPFATMLSGGILTWNLTQYLIFDLIASGRETLTRDMHEGFIVIDAIGRIQDLNPSAVHALGQPAAALNLKPIADLAELNPLQAHLDRKQPGEMHLILDQPDGKRHYRTTITPLSNRRGDHTGHVIVLQDITPQEQAQEALENKERQYAELVERVPVGIFRTTVNGEFLETNTALVQILGVSDRETVLQHNALEFIPQTNLAVWEQLRNGDTIHNAQIQLQRADASLAWVTLSVQAITDALGNIAYYAGALEDITAHKLTELELRDSEQRGRAILQAFPDLMFVIDGSGICHDWYAANTDLLAASPNQLIGKNLRDILPAPFAERVIARCHQVIANGTMGVWEYPLTVANTPRQFEARIVPYGDNKTLSVVRDITERKLAEERSRAYAARLEILHDLDRAIIEAQAPQAIAEAALQRIRELIPCLGCNMVTLTPHLVGARVFASASDIEPPLLPVGTPVTTNNPFLTREGIAQLQRGEVLQFTNAAEYLAQMPEVTSPHRTRIRTLLIVPMRARENLIGIINLISTEDDPFSSEHLAVVQEIAASLAIAIHQSDLREQAQRETAAKTTLLEDVKHRVNGYFATILSLLLREEFQARKLRQKWQASAGGDVARVAQIYETAIAQLSQRVEGLATVHKMLSKTQWQPISLSALAVEVIDTTLAALPDDQFIKLDITPSPVHVDAKSASSLALILHELTTNTIKYALKQRPQGQIALHITAEAAPETPPDVQALTVCLEFRDDGPGYPEPVLQLKDIDVGLQLIEEMVRRDLRGNLDLHNDNGAVARICFRGSKDA
ncbi:MAG: PAS domain S-box protein [Anaerolineae bacterium]|nr:PAS domain S-box protein [Anaerolineae bacterium]